MGWNIVLVQLKPGTVVPGELRKLRSNETQSLGDSEAVRHLISQTIPDVKWEWPGWGQFQAEDHYIEFDSLPLSGSIDAITLRVGGDARKVVQKLCELADDHNWIGFDVGSGELLSTPGF